MNEYLVSHGKIGGVGRFRATPAFAYSRGDRVVIESPRGREVGTVLCPANPEKARLLPPSVSGNLLRRVSCEDQVRLRDLERQGQGLFEAARRLAKAMAMPLEVLDVDMMFDGKQAIVQHLLAETCDLGEYVEQLQRQVGLVVLLENLAPPAEPEEHSHGGCGEPNCGKVDGGSCSTCSTGGGCSSCGSGKVDMAAYFGHLRTKMEQAQRVPLL